MDTYKMHAFPMLIEACWVAQITLQRAGKCTYIHGSLYQANRVCIIIVA